MRIIVSFLFLFVFSQSFSQTVYEHISNEGIYEFLDEMANMKHIQLNDVIKPYSKEMIFEKLNSIEQKKSKRQISLNRRQTKELHFYLMAYNLENKQVKLESNKPNFFLNKSHSLALLSSPIGVVYKDTNFKLLVQPILGASYSNNSNGKLTHTRGGVSLYSYIGSNLGIYTSVRDNNLSEAMINPLYFNQSRGVPFKNFGADGIDFSEARGGLMYSWKWGSIGVVKDHVEWGLGYNGTNIQSGRTPSFAQLKLELKPAKWFEFNYYHGWLVSDVVDSTSSYYSDGRYRVVIYPKYIASNMFTFYPIRNFNFSFGNSVVYSDVGGGGPHLAYMIPFLFYKSVDHTLNSTYKYGESGQNSQLFFNISSRNLKHFHFHFILYMDDLSFSHFSEKDEFNIFSYKGGLRISNILNQNLSLTAEYTLTNPYTYKHTIVTTTYETNSYNMGHYLRDNSKEVFFALSYKPTRGLFVSLSYVLATHYDDYIPSECAQDPECNFHTVPKFENIMWQNQSIKLKARYEVFANTYLMAELYHQDITGVQEKIELYTPEYYWGKTTTISFGATMGF